MLRIRDGNTPYPQDGAIRKIRKFILWRRLPVGHAGYDWDKDPRLYETRILGFWTVVQKYHHGREYPGGESRYWRTVAWEK